MCWLQLLAVVVILLPWVGGVTCSTVLNSFLIMSLSLWLWFHVVLLHIALTITLWLWLSVSLSIHLDLHWPVPKVRSLSVGECWLWEAGVVAGVVIVDVGGIECSRFRWHRCSVWCGVCVCVFRFGVKGVVQLCCRFCAMRFFSLWTLWAPPLEQNVLEITQNGLHQRKSWHFHRI